MDLEAALRTIVSVLSRDAAPAAPVQPEAPLFLTVAQFAERRQLCERTVRNLIARGMPCERPTRRIVRIPVAKAEAWIAAETARASVEAAERRGRLAGRKKDPARGIDTQVPTNDGPVVVKHHKGNEAA